MKTIGQNTFWERWPTFYSIYPEGAMHRIVQKATYPDDREFLGYGIKPDITVTPALQDYLQKKDASLYKALDYLEK